MSAKPENLGHWPMAVRTKAATYDQLVALWNRAHEAHKSEYSIDWYRAGFRDAESHHGVVDTHPKTGEAI